MKIKSALTITILEDNAHQVSQFIKIFKHQVQWPHFGIHELALLNTNRQSKNEISQLQKTLNWYQELKVGGVWDKEKGGGTEWVSQVWLPSCYNLGTIWAGEQGFKTGLKFSSCPTVATCSLLYYRVYALLAIVYQLTKPLKHWWYNSHCFFLSWSNKFPFELCFNYYYYLFIPLYIQEYKCLVKYVQ